MRIMDNRETPKQIIWKATIRIVRAKYFSTITFSLFIGKEKRNSAVLPFSSFPTIWDPTIAAYSVAPRAMMVPHSTL